LQIVEAGLVHFLLPEADGQRYGIVIRSRHICRVSPTRGAPSQDLVDRAANADEQDRQAGQSPGTFGKDVQRFRIRIMVADVGNDIEPQPAVGGYCAA